MVALLQNTSACIMNNYANLLKESRLKGERKDCSVTALAMASGKSYLEVHNNLKRGGRVDRKGTDYNTIMRSVLGLELTYKDVTQEVRTNARTVKSFASIANPKGIYLVFTSGHILCIRDGSACDWTEGRLHRIIQVLQVMPQVEYLLHARWPRVFRRHLYNVVKRPRTKGAVDRVLTVADQCWVDAGRPSANSDLKTIRCVARSKLQAEGLNKFTISTQLCRWQKILTEK